MGGLIAAGRGLVAVEGLRQALEAQDRGGWPAPAPARGLTLVRVDYPPAEEPASSHPLDALRGARVLPRSIRVKPRSMRLSRGRLPVPRMISSTISPERYPML